MTCGEVWEKLTSAFSVPGQFEAWTRAERGAIAGHLGSCESCRRMLNQLPLDEMISVFDSKSIQEGAVRVSEMVAGDLADDEYREVAGPRSCGNQARHLDSFLQKGE